MNQRFGWVALGALGLVIGCGDGGTTSTSGGGGSTSAAIGTGGGGGATSTATGAGGGTATSSSTGAGGGSPGEACNPCVSTKDVFKDGTMCAMTLATCIADVDCDAWYKCVQNCQTTTFTTECFAACDQGESIVSNLYLPVYECVCTACKTDCEPACH